MKRKIIKQANAAYTITLPIDWVRKNNLSEKSELDLSLSGKSLVISSGSNVLGGKAKIDAKGVEEGLLNVYLSSLYAKGVDEIEVVSEENITPMLTRTLNILLGYALVSKEKERYIIKDIGGGSYANLDDIFKRVFQMVILYYEDAMKDILGVEKEKFDDLKLRDLEVNKFCLYLQRAINKMSYNDSIDGRILFTYSFALEKVGDEIFRMWRANIEEKPKKTKEVKEMMELCLQGLEESFDLYYQFSPSKKPKNHKIKSMIREKARKLNADTKTLLFISHIIKIIEEAVDLNHLTMMKQFQKEKRD